MNYDDDLNLKVKQQNELNNIHIKESNRLFRDKDRSDRQTIDQVLDTRISRIISHLKNTKKITEFSGCISTGKEANVYFAKGIPDASYTQEIELAVKIYKTSILIFKDRDRYINGEFRFRHGYCKSNPRKMVALWAEKEVRNLKRISLSGIKAPKPFILKSNLIVMQFVGKEQKAAPRLKDVIKNFNDEQIIKAYKDCIQIMRKMFKECRLVHSDFSEYNLLYHNNEIWVIDVAQAVEHDHPNGFNFLKRDIHNINEFFSKNGVDIILDQHIFEYITKFEKDANNLDEFMEVKKEEIREKLETEPEYVKSQNDMFGVFEIPRTLMEEEVDKITGNVDIENAMKNLVGIVEEKKKKEEENVRDEEDDENESDEEDEELESKEEENEEDPKDVKDKKEKKKKPDRFEGMTNKERHQIIKMENRERRANKKVNKKQKKQIIKKTTKSKNK